jgi:hypothetical protein
VLVGGASVVAAAVCAEWVEGHSAFTSLTATRLHPMKMSASPRPRAGFPQRSVLDPERNVVEVDAETLDLTEE